MRLKSIKLAGFKSFVDPTTVNFPSNMCSVVGPNGCGKSNIIDAVRWVMGESSAKNLRGEAMTDVIFNGTTHRQPVGQASIELIFDNTDGKIVGEYAAYNEISVRRIVGRDGTSEYWLNGSKCRRRDITDLFLGTGLGPRSYAIIEQGMISRLIESKPEELRIFIEEAAGISKYKERRRETESRMRRTVENLERLTDLREELERNLSHLQRQAQAAEKYAEFKKEEREVKAQLLALQWREFQSNNQDSQTKMQDLEVRQEAERAEQQRIASLIEKLRIELTDATDHFNDVQANYYTVGGEVTRVEQALRFQKERRATIEQDLAQTQVSLQGARGHLDADRERLANWREELAVIDPDLAIQREAAEEAAIRLSDAEQGMTRWQGHWDEFNQRAAGPKQTSEVQQSRIVYLEQVLRRLQERITRIDGERASLAANNNVDSVDQLDVNIERADEVVAAHDTALESLNAQIQTQREGMERLRRVQDEHRSELQQLKGQRSSLLALQQAATQDSEADELREWLHSLSVQDSHALFESISVNEGWAPAVEQVLGSALTAVCVDNLEQLLNGDFSAAPAGACIVSQREAEGAALAGTLAAQTRGPAALNQWLGKVFTASDLSGAVSLLATLPEDSSVITPEGQWLGHGWARVRSLAGGNSGVIERRELLEQVEGRIDVLEAQLAQVDEDLATARELRGELEQQLANEQRASKDAVRRQADLIAERKTSLAAIEQLRQRQSQLMSDQQEAKHQFESEQEALSAARAELAEALDQMAMDGEERERLLSQRDELRDGLQTARDSARDARDAAHRSDVRAQNLRTQINTVASTIQRLEQQVEQLEARIGELNLQLPETDEPDAELTGQLEELLAQRVQAESALTNARQFAADKEHALREEEKNKVNVEHKLQAIHTEIETQRLKQAERQVRIENLETQLKELEATPEAVVATLPEEASEPEWQVKVERIANRITRLGPINLAAIDECARASERKNYLDAQNEDLESALGTLENAIRKIDKETRSRFQETFEQVNAGFAELFPRVFGGGTASLEMTGDDLLDTGVAIMARPPGKKNSTIHLLSGGEKAMTAIALVFSIFRLNPAPFCMLDEVDAPLDDANVGRYARMVKEMSEQVQFIFITHNKVTMEAADHLMGVTMHEPGVSRLVTVDVEEAAQLAAS